MMMTMMMMMMMMIVMRKGRFVLQGTGEDETDDDVTICHMPYDE